jgi:hypothetical protein
MAHGTAHTSVDAIPQEVLAVLALPQREDLPDAQQRGACCVWCRAPLTGESSLSMDEQRDGDERWFPRSCRTCAASRAHDALFVHAATCTQCADDAAACDVHRALFRLVRQEWR